MACLPWAENKTIVYRMRLSLREWASRWVVWVEIRASLCSTHMLPGPPSEDRCPEPGITLDPTIPLCTFFCLCCSFQLAWAR